MQRMIAFYHDKGIDMLKLGWNYQTWLTFAYANLPMQNFIPPQREVRTFWKKSRTRRWWSIYPFNTQSSCWNFHAKVYRHMQIFCCDWCQPTIPLTDVSIYAHRSLFIRVGRSIQKAVDSHLDKTRPVPLKIWSWLIFNVEDLIVNLRASTLQANRRKLITSVLMGFVFIATVCLKQWDSFTTFVPVKSCAHLSLKKISYEAVG